MIEIKKLTDSEKMSEAAYLAKQMTEVDHYCDVPTSGMATSITRECNRLYGGVSVTVRKRKTDTGEIYYRVCRIEPRPKRVQQKKKAAAPPTKKKA